MIRKGDYKYIHYIGFEPQLFNLENDADELNDLASDPEYALILRECEIELRKIINPGEVDRQAKEEQAVMIEGYGGKEKLLEDGFNIPFSPVPSQFLIDKEKPVVR